jgi:hypothetical protein
MTHCLRAQRLRFCSGSKLRRNRADKQRFKSEFDENRPNFAQAQHGSVELEIYKVMICIDFVTKARNRLELKIQLKDFVQVAQTPRIHFQFDHNILERSQPIVSAQFFSVGLVCVRRKAAIKDGALKE